MKFLLKIIKKEGEIALQGYIEIPHWTKN